MKALENLKTILPDKIVKAHIKYLDQQLSIALTKTAFKLNQNSDQEKESNKEHAFKTDSKSGVGYLLYEFANGTGKDLRDFSFDYDMSQKFFSGNVPNDIKANFHKILLEKNLSYDQFVSNAQKIDGGILSVQIIQE